MGKKSAGLTFVKELPQNIFAGFVVSLVALPLGLGLAIASEAPPLAGIIAAATGGIVVAIFGGSHVTIAGPGNGLVIVLLGAITTLGGGNLSEGYLLTLAAIILSGGLLFLFGALRLGAMSEFFPASALQGMLAAIGVGILAKQFHVMLGLTSVSGGTAEQLMRIPDSLVLFFGFHPFAGIIGVISILFLFFYSKIRNPYFHLIPAPMWVVVGSIGAGYYYTLFLNEAVPIPQELLIKIPNELISNLPRPNFDRLLDLEFLGVVVSITLIAIIESLLSIKAVDKLDPKKRRSNVNKDLRALGLASIVSGFLGGLNVVTVIARSSVNANNGGTNRSANFFHAGFLVLFVVFLGDQIQRIPLTALAAILVFTGYKLASPENLVRIYKIGREQALIFIITLITTLFTGLITGIAVGILSTFITHLFLRKSLYLFSLNVFKPNVLMYREEQSGNYYVSVKNFCSFLNFYRLKMKLDQIPESEHAIVDFSLCDFVDHTVMEGLHDYQHSFDRKNGLFEAIGLDLHAAETQHPFAVRKSLPLNALMGIQNALTNRQKNLEGLAEQLAWEYLPKINSNPKGIEKFLFFESKVVNYSVNTLKNKKQNFNLFDLSYSEGAFITKEDLKGTFLLFNSPIALPVFVLDKEDFKTTLYQWAGFDDINFKKHPDFSKRFHLSGNDQREIKALFGSELIYFFESHPIFHIESNGKRLLIKGNDRLSGLQEIKIMLSFAQDLVKLLEKSERN
ncbi:MAG: carbonic anhydrase [Flavobacteriaceae bacterium]|jgi:carbonic anhydrase|tara:strand:+ start:2173 stop:4383 length:2211 start_codon:yes stop_codon:yes gene_type:complete